MHGEMPRDSMALPGFFSTVLRSLADIPRQQPINDNLAAIEALSTRMRRLRHILEGMQEQVDAAIERAVGPRFFLFRLTPQRLADWRSRTQTQAAKEAGFAYAAYGQLKMSQVVDGAAERLAMLSGGNLDEIRHAVWSHVRGRGIDATAQATARNGAASDYVTFLRGFDVEFRIRRLRFVIRRANMLAEQLGADDPARAAFDQIKTDLYAVLQPLTALRRPQSYDRAAREGCRDAAHRPAEALATLEAAMNLKAIDAVCDDQLTAALGPKLPATIRRPLLRAYLGFPFYDIALLPLMQEGGMDELDEIKVDRMSPDDATALRSCGGAELKGAQFNAFGAFFSRAYREHDYLWGRLHAAERLIDIVASTAPEGVLSPAVIGGIKRQAFRAIVAAETPFLKAIPDQINLLRAALADATLSPAPSG
jgi:hypothetical protein